MATEEVSELLVKVRPDTGDTEEQLGNVQEKFDETADETERTAGILGDTAGLLKGAAGAIVGTLVTLAAGILTQVPVIGESMSAFGAIIDSIALKIDEDLRPSMSEMNRELFAAADEFNRSEGSGLDFLRLLGRMSRAVNNFFMLSPFELAQQITDFLEGSVSGFEGFISGIQTEWDVFWNGLINRAKGGANGIIGKVEGLVNRSIRALNKLPFFDEDPVSLARFETKTQKEIRQLAETREAAREGRLEPKGGGRAGGIDSRQIDRIIDSLRNTDRQTNINVDGKTVARTVEPLLGRAPPNVGRNMGIR